MYNTSATFLFKLTNITDFPLKMIEDTLKGMRVNCIYRVYEIDRFNSVNNKVCILENIFVL